VLKQYSRLLFEDGHLTKYVTLQSNAYVKVSSININYAQLYAKLNRFDYFFYLYGTSCNIKEISRYS